jgi:acid phosphatase
MLSLITLSLLLGARVARAASSEPAESTVQPTLTAIEAAAATQAVLSPVSNVKGVAFDRFIQVWLENTVCDAKCAVRCFVDVN